MLIQQLLVRNIRSHEEFSLQLSPDTTLITGPNGAGKTALLEALFVVMQGSSFKGGDGLLLRHGEDWWRIDVRFDDETERSVKYNSALVSGKKIFSVLGREMKRLSYQQKIPTVLFEPEDLRLFHGAPTRRREFIDRLIGQLEPNYLTVVRRYERALKQRNSLLKRPQTTLDDVFVWDVALSNYGAQITSQRISLIERVNRQLGEMYESVARTGDTVSVHYSHTLIDGVEQKLLRELNQSFERDHAIGATSVGPHRHDVLFELNGHPALSVASRGEVRSMMLAVKQIESDIIEQVLDKKPVILLDDVFAELDSQRQQHLIDSFADRQTIITSIHPVGEFYTVNIDHD